MSESPEYGVGDVVLYASSMGEIRKVRVTERHEDIKNGIPGFDGVLSESTERNRAGFPCWGYDSQIISVEQRLEDSEGEPIFKMELDQANEELERINKTRLDWGLPPWSLPEALKACHDMLRTQLARDETGRF